MQSVELSAPHRKLIGYLREAGFYVVAEAPFWPYTVDCYLPDSHTAIEVDGPHHGIKREAIRDRYLLEKFGVPTMRIKIKDVKPGAVESIALFVALWEPSFLTRKVLEQEAQL